MAGLQVRAFIAPDETRRPDKTQVDVVKMGANTAARLTLEPGWKWSECIKPIAGTDSCQVRHVGVVQSGRMHVIHDDGSEGDIGPGEAYVIEPGHDAWVVGDEPLVGFEFESPTAEVFAKTYVALQHGAKNRESAARRAAAQGCGRLRARQPAIGPGRWLQIRLSQSGVSVTSLGAGAALLCC